MSSVTRLTLFALISGLEEDLRTEIRVSLIPQKSASDLFGEEIYRKCVERFSKDVDMTQDGTESPLVDYLDFGESFQVLSRNKGLLSDLYAKHLKSFAPQLESLVPVRNRVMHTRPLLFDDLAKTSEIAKGLVAKIPAFWKRVSEALTKLSNDPSFVLGLMIPPQVLDEDPVGHNLPLPDFDETGFLGRSQQVAELIKTCLGPYPVITIVGEGGIGKTALALRVAYEIVDTSPGQFDYVVWTSSKTTAMTAQEMVRIEGAIETSLGLMQAVATELGAQGDVSSESNEILSYLGQFKILLILDNLETVLDDRIRSFLQNLPPGSKVLITSRIGLGALEYPIQLREMDTSDSVQLLRALSRARNVEQLVKVPNSRLEKYCQRMKNNPGFIKWFISAVQAGKRPEEVLSKPEAFLDFCMSNVYQYLSVTSREVLKSMQTIPGELSQAELAFLSGIDDIQLQRALQELLTTNMVNMVSVPVGSTYRSTYTVSDLARIYLAKNHPPSTAESQEITRRKNQLLGITQLSKGEFQQDPYSFFTINRSSKSDLVVAKYLLDALASSRRRDFAEADKQIETAKRLSPEYYEVHRVEAIVNNAKGNITAARTAYEAAIELEPNSAPLRLWYAQFLFRAFQDFEEAKVQLLSAAKLDVGSVNVSLELTRVHLALREFEQAEKQLSVVGEKEHLLGSLDRKKFVDVTIRLHKDRAESHTDNKDSNAALDEFKAMIKAYINCPRSLVDEKMREKLRRSIPSVIECHKQMRAGMGVKPDLTRVIEWLNKYAGGTPIRLGQSSHVGESGEACLRGKIDRLLQHRGFGFILDDGNQRHFFHFSQLIEGNVSEGQRVEFVLGQDGNGRPCAKGVTAIEDQ